MTVRWSHLALCALAAAAGCGYTMGYSNRELGIRTVSVAVAGNATFRQNLEIPLTRALFEALSTYSDLTPAGPGQGDGLLKVEIMSVGGRNLVGAGSTPVREGALDYTVNVALFDQRTGTLLRERVVLDRATFRIAVSETEQTAIAEASFDLARKIVLALEGDF